MPPKHLGPARGCQRHLASCIRSGTPICLQNLTPKHVDIPWRRHGQSATCLGAKWRGTQMCDDLLEGHFITFAMRPLRRRTLLGSGGFLMTGEPSWLFGSELHAASLAKMAA